MTDDLSAISGEREGYVPCDEVALAVAASGQDANAVYGDNEGFVALNNAASAESADETDTSAVAGTSAGYVPGPCLECDAFEEFDGFEASGWGSNSDDVWVHSGGTGTTSVSGGLGHMNLSVPGTVGPPPNPSDSAIFTTGPTNGPVAIHTNTSWTMRSSFSVVSTVDTGSDVDTLIEFSIFNTGNGDQSAWALERSTANATGYANLQVDDNGVTIYNPGFLANPILFDANGTYGVEWVFTLGGTQQIYLNSALILSGPAFAATLIQAGGLAFKVSGSIGKSGAFAGSAASTILFDYIRFCT